jgi:asparagine synthase (glutamine-hydrolysing)
LSSFYVFSPNSSIDNVKSVEPGSILTISKNFILNKTSFYSKDLIKFKFKKKFDLQNEIIKAVDRQLISDVPVGLLLSSGLDSMSILASIKKLGKLDQIETYTSHYDNKNFSEEKNVMKISKEWGLKSHFINISNDDVYNNLDDYFKCFDDLEFMPNSFAMYFLCKNIKKNHKVLLTGIGGDEIFLSYKTHIANYIKKFFPKNNKVFEIINHFSNLLPNSNTYLSFKEKFQRFSIGSMYDIEYSYFIWRHIFSPLELEKNFHKNIIDSNVDHIFENQRQQYNFFMNDNYSLKKSMSYIDINTWLVDHGLKLWDKAGMYNSIEIRVPLLDLDFLNGLFQQPDSIRNLKYGHKTVLKNSFNDILPNYILDFPKKGFSIPVFDWLSDKRINNKFKDLTYSLKDTLISEKYLKYMWKELDNGNNNFAFKLWNLGCLQGWKIVNNLEISS